MSAAKVYAFRPAPLAWEDVAKIRAATPRAPAYFNRAPLHRLFEADERTVCAYGKAATAVDPRDPSNVAPHVDAAPYNGPKLTPARAAKRRREQLAACGCRRCALALNPPQTFAEWARFVDPIDTSASYDMEARWERK